MILLCLLCAGTAVVQEVVLLGQDALAALLHVDRILVKVAFCSDRHHLRRRSALDG